MIKASSQHRGWPPLILRSPKYDDRSRTLSGISETGDEYSSYDQDPRDGEQRSDRDSNPSPKTPTTPRTPGLGASQ